MTHREKLQEIRKEDRFAAELEDAFRPRPGSEPLKFGWRSVFLVVLAGIAIASLALPFYLGTPIDPDPAYVEGLFTPVSS